MQMSKAHSAVTWMSFTNTKEARQKKIDTVILFMYSSKTGKIKLYGFGDTDR